jgi:hypothetical protein
LFIATKLFTFSALARLYLNRNVTMDSVGGVFVGACINYLNGDRRFILLPDGNMGLQLFSAEPARGTRLSGWPWITNSIYLTVSQKTLNRRWYAP